MVTFLFPWLLVGLIIFSYVYCRFEYLILWIVCYSWSTFFGEIICLFSSNLKAQKCSLSSTFFPLWSRTLFLQRHSSSLISPFHLPNLTIGFSWVDVLLLLLFLILSLLRPCTGCLLCICRIWPHGPWHRCRQCWQSEQEPCTLSQEAWMQASSLRWQAGDLVKPGNLSSVSVLT